MGVEYTKGYKEMCEEIDWDKSLTAMLKMCKSSDAVERAMGEMFKEEVLKLLKPSVLLGEVCDINKNMTIAFPKI